MPDQQRPLAEAAYSFFSHARFAWALTFVTVTTVLCLDVLELVLGTAGIITLITSELSMLGAVLITRRRSIAWREAKSLLLWSLLLWTGISLVWSYYANNTFTGILEILAVSALALSVTLMRDTIQLLKIFGDALFLLLALSIGLEILSGLILDMPLPSLGVKGKIFTEAGIQGIFESRNQLAFVAIFALITFSFEKALNSVTTARFAGNATLAVTTLLLCASPVALISALTIFTFTGLIIFLRKKRKALQKNIELATVSVLVGLLAIIWTIRGKLFELLDNQSLFSYRFQLWADEWRLIKMKILEGWGWVGEWPEKTQPFSVLRSGSSNFQQSGLNTYLDMWLQLGVVGLVLLLILAGITGLRLWKNALASKNVLSIWPLLVMFSLLIFSIFESVLQTPIGWFIFVILVILGRRSLLSRNLQ